MREFGRRLVELVEQFAQLTHTIGEEKHREEIGTVG